MASARTILVTGGAGFIGSHTCVELLNEGYNVVVVDSLVNSCEESLRRVKELTGKDLTFYRVDLADVAAVDDIFAKHSIFAVIHFAALKAVGESVTRPLDYYKNNLGATLGLLSSMKKAGVKRLVFSSSATVYGDPQRVPIDESAALHVTNPYGATKLMCEDIMRDLARGEPGWQIILLRYFNPIGAHPSGRIGEDPQGIPNNLVPYILQVAVGKRPYLTVHGNDWPTSDGTGVRDYIHVVDLAQGHTASLRSFTDKQDQPSDCRVYNLGTGKGNSVLEMVAAIAKASGKEVPYKVGPRRSGDIAVCYADPSKAAKELGWKAKLTTEDACRDGWKWQSLNPNGFKS